jgi:uncharacterized membrane protein YoaK (UPF0700 family)
MAGLSEFDAFSFLAYDHVFANAQTGNVVLFAVFASAGDWSHAARYSRKTLRQKRAYDRRLAHNRRLG